MLKAEGYGVIAVDRISKAKEQLKVGHVQVLLTDLKLEREDGLTLLKWIREENYPTPVIILTAHGSIDSAVDAMKQGAFDYISKPFERSELIRTIHKAVLNVPISKCAFVKNHAQHEFSRRQ